MLKNEAHPRPKTAGSWLVERLRRAIIEGEMEAGTQIRQEEIAETYGVSRMPVRQALDVLAAEGWIEQRPHRNAVVTSLDPEDAIELFDVRTSLEALAIERSFPRLTNAQIASIKAAWEALKEQSGDVPELHQSFHLSLYAAAGPRLLRLVMQQLDAAQRYLRFEKSMLNNSDIDQSEHEELIAAAIARDPARGVKIIKEHIAGGGRSIAKTLRAREKPKKPNK